MKSRTYIFFIFVALILATSMVTGNSAAQWSGEGVDADSPTTGFGRYQPAFQEGYAQTTAQALLAGATVLITEQGLNPGNVSLRTGQTITWINRTSSDQRLMAQAPLPPMGGHLVFLPMAIGGMGGSVSIHESSNDPQGQPQRANWSSNIPPGGSYTQTFSQLGNFTYFVDGHPDWTAQVTVSPAGNDVLTPNFGRESVAAVVNPRNPGNVAIANFCRLRLSTDFGQSFPTVVNCPTPGTLTGLGYGTNADDALSFDSQGNLYWVYLLVLDINNDGAINLALGEDVTVVVAQIDPTNGDVGAVVDLTPGNFFDDKPWIAADSNPGSPYVDNLYVVWTRLRVNPTRIQYSRSTDNGTTWSGPQPIGPVDNDGDGLVDEDAIDGMDNDGDLLVDEDPPEGLGFVWPSDVAVASNGDVYVAYHTNTCGAANTGTVRLLRDGNGGANFASGTVPQVNNAFGAGQATVTCNRQDDMGDLTVGDTIPGADFWLQGTMQPWILPNPLSPNKVYVIANDDPNNIYNNGDDADVVIARSSDFGVTFSLGRVDHGPGQSFAVMPTAHIDQDGKIVVTWYDNRRNIMNTGVNANFLNPNFLLDLYATTSNDGGRTFVNDFRISDSPFDPDVGSPCRFAGAPNFGTRANGTCTARIGEYNGVWTVNGIGYSTWTGNTTPPAPPFPADGVGAHRIYFDMFSMDGVFPDRLEPNESIDFAVAAALGSDDTYNEPRLTIHSATDVDFFKVVALHTGKLAVEIEFNERINNLNLQVRDRYNNVIAVGTPEMTQTGSSLETLALPVVQGEFYFVEVFDQNGPNAFPPQSTYDLTIVNRPAPVPFELDLRSASDSGDDDDDLTSDSMPTIQLRVDDVDFLAEGILFSPTDGGSLADDPPGFKVQIFDNGNEIPFGLGFATPVMGQPGVYEFTFPLSLPDGPHSITARVVIVDPSDDPDSVGIAHFVGQGGESDSLMVTVNTAAPDCSGASPPDLLDSSDDAGINIDNITTIMAPAFGGTAAANVTVHILANGDIVGISQAGADASDGVPGDGLGAYEVTVEPLRDGVYAITAMCVSEAGVVSDPTPALQVTIANKALNLSGASGDVLVNLADNMYAGSPTTVTGYPGIIGGTAGISDIPVVNLDLNGQALTIQGRGLDDNLTFTPTGPQGGSVTRAESPQVLNLSGIGGTFTIDPADGVDMLTVVGSAIADVVLASVDVTAAVKVNSLQEVQAPIATTEWLAISSGQGEDTIDITVFDTVNAALYVDAGTPATTNPVGDVLNITAGSPSGHLQKQPGGPVTGAGSVFVTYPQTTDTTTRIDYEEVEVVKLFK